MYSPETYGDSGGRRASVGLPRRWGVPSLARHQTSRAPGDVYRVKSSELPSWLIGKGGLRHVDICIGGDPAVGLPGHGGLAPVTLFIYLFPWRI
ncbi:hypothetical protein AB1N83_013459 [Pleurotus pulmonarius]